MPNVTIVTDDGLEREMDREVTKYFANVATDEDEAVMAFSSDMWPLIDQYIKAHEAAPERTYTHEELPYSMEKKTFAFPTEYIPDLSDDDLINLCVAASQLGFNELMNSCAARVAYRFKQLPQDDIVEFINSVNLTALDE